MNSRAGTMDEEMRTAQWIVLVPATTEWIEAHGRQIWEQLYDEDDFAQLVLIAGPLGHQGLASHNPALTELDTAFASALSVALARPVYRLWLKERLVARFEVGREIVLDEGPAAVIDRLGWR